MSVFCHVSNLTFVRVLSLEGQRGGDQKDDINTELQKTSHPRGTRNLNLSKRIWDQIRYKIKPPVT